MNANLNRNPGASRTVRMNLAWRRTLAGVIGRPSAIGTSALLKPNDLRYLLGMSPIAEYRRSNLMMSRHDTALIVIDVQQKLVAAIPERDRIIWNIRRLLDGARIVGVPVLGSEQYPEKLGSTDQALLDAIPFLTNKLAFSCCGAEGFIERLKELPVHKVLVVGIETHVCVMQTVFDLLTAGYDVYVGVDATGARYEIDSRTALDRMQSSGVTLTTTEAALFEWCQVAGTAQFKEISQIVRRPLTKSE